MKNVEDKVGLISHSEGTPWREGEGAEEIIKTQPWPRN